MARNISPQSLLIIGAIAGAVLAAGGLLEPSQPALPPNQVAAVNGQPITKADYLGYLDLLARDKRNPLTERDRRHVLDRVIEERLMIERGLELGLAHSDPKVRKTIVNAMIQLAIADAASVAPSERQLAEFYDSNRAYFTPPGQVQLRRLVFRGDNALQRAHAARRRLDSEPWLDVASQADPDLLGLPSTPLPVSKLRGYLGPTLTEASLALEPGTISEPLPDQAGFTLVQLLALQPGSAPALADIRDQVIREYQRRAGDEALRDYLDQLRRSADIEIDERFLDELAAIDDG